MSKKDEKLDPVIVEMWKDYKVAVKNFGYGNEAEEVLIKIYSRAGVLTFKI
jgi:hypothetical protein